MERYNTQNSYQDLLFIVLVADEYCAFSIY